MKSYKKFIFIFSFLFIANAHALLLVEPHLGYNLIGTGQNETVPATTFKYNGLQYGLRVGAQTAGFMGGLDYTHSSFNQMTSGYQNDFSRSEMGIFVGYNFPIMIRVWTGYNFSYSAEASTSSALLATGSKYEGHSTELGAGFTGFPYISLNASLKMITLDSLRTSSSTTSLTGNSQVSIKELVFGVSAPFNLF